MPPTHYELLGLASDASALDIRHAYLALIKRYHPDVSAEGPSDFVRAVNAAYRALSDPVRRARYDTTLGIAHAVILRALPVPPPLPRRRTRWGSRLAGLSLLAVVACYLLYVRSAPASGSRPAARAVLDVPDGESIRARRAAIVQQAGLNFEWVALQSDVAAAERYSQQCWHSLLGTGSDSLFDYCLAFDAVGQHTFGAERVYFAATALMNRARAFSAGRLIAGESLAQRIARVDALLARERRKNNAAPPSVSWFPIAGSALPAPRTR